MNAHKKFFHIFLSVALSFLPYFIFFQSCWFLSGYYYFYIDKLVEIIQAVGIQYFYQANITYFVPTVLGIIYLYLSYKVTYNFWKNQTKLNYCLLYGVNSILLSPVGFFITHFLYHFLKNIIE